MAGEAAGFRWLTVGKLKELLSKLDDSLLVHAQSMAQTGHLTVFTKEDSCVAVVNFLDEEVERYDVLE